MIPDSLTDWLTEQNLSIRGQQSLTGGCVADAARLDLSNGESLFIKYGGGVAKGQYKAEAAGLNSLRVAKVLKVPDVVLAADDFLLLEFIPVQKRTPEFWRELGIGMARLHRLPATEFGYDCDTFCGGTRQPNKWCRDGHYFFAEQRLRYLAEKCFLKQQLPGELYENLLALAERLPELIPEQRPALLHGDLWSGNVISGSQGEPVLIDPAVYCGWPEAELAMTLLFGGFEPEFYDSYLTVYPQLPGWRERAGLYNLWHLLNHLYLFGSGYLPEIQQICRRYR